MSDPRLLVIGKRLSRIKKIIPIMSSKGGVGKTLIASLSAYELARRGYRIGLLDLDLTNPSTHIVLGIEPEKLEIVEEKGVLPPEVHGIKYMTMAIYVGDNPSPLRGEAINDAFLEILAITRWGDLDYLLIDTPPGLSDVQLDLLSYLGDKVLPLIIGTPSPLSVKSIEKMITVLKEGGYNILGLIENMSPGKHLAQLAEKHGIKYLGSIPYDEEIDRYLGVMEGITKTRFMSSLKKILDHL